MNKLIIFILVTVISLLIGCSPIKNAVTNQYKLDAFSETKLSKLRSQKTILISPPDAVTGYQTDQMLYVKKRFEVSPFAQNSWIGPPADMLYPLIIQSVQRTGYFFAVSAGTNSDQTDYRLDTQLIELQQNFLKIPSEINLVARVVLTNMNDNRVVASQVISKHVPCPLESPYGGVVAANIATKQFTAELSHFVVNQARRDR